MPPDILGIEAPFIHRTFISVVRFFPGRGLSRRNVNCKLYRSEGSLCTGCIDSLGWLSDLNVLGYIGRMLEISSGMGTDQERTCKGHDLGDTVTYIHGPVLYWLTYG